MAMALQSRVRPGAKANCIPATPSESSEATTPIPAANRFDLLMNEQVTLVKNAQEGLQQSMAFLQLASSKEEQESATIQVQSLLARAEELVLTLQVIMEIRTELGHAQKELAEAKRAHKDSSHLRGRIQWLEQHLDRLLLTRRRCTLAARGRRTMPMQPWTTAANGTQPGFQQRGVRPSRFRIQPRTNTYRHAPTIPSPSKSITDSIETPSRMDTPSRFSATQYSDRATSILVRDSTAPASCSGKIGSMDSSSPPPGTTCKSGSQSSSKRSASRDSDVWHSESEANWTMVEAYSNPMKDITQSQVLSSGDDEQKQSLTDPDRPSFSRQYSVAFSETPQVIFPDPSLQHKETLSSFTEDEGSRHFGDVEGVGSELPQLPLLQESQQQVQEEASMDLDTPMYGFESPRQAEVFGQFSWNSLCLAVNKNYVKQGKPERRKTAGEKSDLTTLMLRAGMHSICQELDSLQQLIHTAARAATEPGVAMPSPNKAHRRISSYRNPSAQVLDGMRSNWHVLTKSEGATSAALPKLPSLTANGTPSAPVPPPSRKIYGKKADPYIYPRPSNTWHNFSSPNLRESWSTDEAEACHSTLQTYELLRTRSTPRRRRLKSSRYGRKSSLHAGPTLSAFITVCVGWYIYSAYIDEENVYLRQLICS